MTFRVGMKVVCIDASNTSEYPLTKGAVYTISGGGYYLFRYLYDIAEVSTSVPHAWCGTRFRPVVERKTSIECFKALLKPSSVDA